MNKAARTKAWDAVLLKATLHAATSPPSASTHARALDCYGGAATVTKRLERRNEHPAAKVLFAALVLAGVVLLLAIAGCVAPEAIDQCDAQARLCHDDALDAALPLEARQAEADNCRAWCQQRETLTGHPVPAAATWVPLPPELDPPPASSPAPAGGGR